MSIASSISLDEFTARKCVPVYEKYRAGGLIHYMNLVDLHWQIVRETELQKFEQVNKSIFRSIQSFRTHMDEEISRLGKFEDLTKDRARIVLLNKVYRDRASLHGNHHSLKETDYLLRADDRREVHNDIWTKEWQMCGGHVISEATTTWYIITIPNFVHATRAVAPDLNAFIQLQKQAQVASEVRIEAIQAKKYIDDLLVHLGSEDRVRQGQAELQFQKEALEMSGKWLQDRFFEFTSNLKVIKEIWDRKQQLIEMRLMKLQCDRVDKENKDFVKDQAGD